MAFGPSTRCHLSRWAPVCCLALTVLVLSGCAQHYPQTTLAPRGDFARLVDQVFMTTVRWAAVVFFLVEGALLYAVFRFRGKPGDGEPAQVHGNTTLEIVWTVIPAVILAFIAVPTIKAIFKTAEVPTDNPLVVEVIGHQWWWEFRYPEYGIVTANEFHVPVGRTVDLRMTTADVVHSFWVPQFAAKRDVFPKRDNRLWFKAEVAGNFPGQCAEFCGIQHGRMGYRIIAESPEAFAAWTANETASGPVISDSVHADLQAGKQLFLTAGCVGCHAMAGQPTEKLVNLPGPNLSHLGSRTTLVAGLMPNTAENLARWLRAPQELKVGSLMKLPRPLTEDEVQALVRYLRAHR